MDDDYPRLARFLACALCALALVACGGRERSDVGGTLSGLNAGASVTVADNADTITLSENGEFEFPASVDADHPYSVVVVTQPAGQTCTVTNGTGTLDDDADPVDNVSITCVDTPTGATN